MARPLWVALLCWQVPVQVKNDKGRFSAIRFAAASTCSAGMPVTAATRAAGQARQRSESRSNTGRQAIAPRKVGTV